MSPDVDASPPPLSYAGPPVTQQEALQSVLEHVLCLSKDSGLRQALNAGRYTKINQVIGMPLTSIQALSYKMKVGTSVSSVKLAQGEEDALVALQGFARSRAAALRQDQLKPGDWLLATEEEFDQYLGSLNSPPPPPVTSTSTITTPLPSSVPAPTTTPPAVPYVAPPPSAVSSFKRGIKRDQSLFPVLKDEKDWDDWQRRLRTQATAQGVENVLDSYYNPSPSERDLFEEQNKYMMAVFTNCVLTDYGKGLIRHYEGTNDARGLFLDLEYHALSSTTAILTASELLSYITTATLGKNTWNGTTTSFVLHWEEQVRLYERYTKTHSHFSPEMKRTLLQNAVNGIPDLRQVKLNADQLLQANGYQVSFADYRNLLLNACARYDAEWHPRAQRTPTSNRRTVYATHVDPHASDDIDPPPDFGFDTPVSVVSAFRTRMSGSQWHKLDEESQRIWDSLPDSAKEIILGDNPRPRAGARRPGSRPTRPPERRQVQLHDSYPDHNMGSDYDGVGSPDDEDAVEVEPEPPRDDDHYLAMATNRMKPRSPADPRNMMSSSRARGEPSTPRPNKPATDTSTGTRAVNSTRLINACALTYSVSKHQRSFGESLVDRGANGGLAGTDMRVITTSPYRSVHVEGIDNHQVRDVPIVTAGGVLHTTSGDVIGIFHQYAHINKGTSIHSSVQLEAYKQDVNDRSLRTPGGKQRILTVDGYVIPLTVRNGLPYLNIRPYTDLEFDTLPHVIMTSDHDWDPSILDCGPDDVTKALDAHDLLQERPIHENFNQSGEYMDRYVVTSVDVSHPIMEEQILPSSLMFRRAEHITPADDGMDIPTDDPTDTVEDKSSTVSPLKGPRKVSNVEPDYEKLRPFFAYQPVESIKHTWLNSTQFARIPMSTHLKRHFKSPFPAHNVHRRNEPIATDTVYSNTPAVDNGASHAQFFVGTESMVCDVFPMKTDKQFVNTLEDIIRRRGAPTKLVSDSAQVEISKKVHDILRSLCITDWQSEPYQQHQNPAERRYQTVKRITSTLMDRTGAPPDTWFLCMSYVCFILNHTACKAINWQIPMRVLTGTTPDISPILRFSFYQPVYYAKNEPSFPSDSREARGRFVGIAEHVGHAMTFQILTDDTNKIIERSLVRAADPEAPNKRADPPPTDEADKSPATSDAANGDIAAADASGLKLVDYTDLIGRSFLLDLEDGERARVHVQEVVDAVEDHEYSTQLERGHVKFKVKAGDKYEDVMTYDQIVSKIEQEMDSDIIWKFKRITSHEGPLTPKHSNYKGSMYNVMVEWENGEITSEPLSIIAADDPVTCAIYARDNNLLELPGWKRFKRLAKRQKKLFRMANQAKLRSYNTAPRFKYGFEIPRDYKHALWLDKRNGNNKWKDATKLELDQQDEYSTFKDVGDTPPKGYKKIRVHLVFDVKHDGRHKARLVADGHLTDIPLDSVYSGVVSLRGIRLLTFISELNALLLWATDIGNAYLEALTKELVYIVAGPEFGDREGHILVIVKALYGLRTSGLRWHERLADCLRAEGFTPCKAEPDIWMRANGDVYEYIAVYVDDLAIAMLNPEEFVKILIDKYKFKLKGTGPISFHLGCEFVRDDEGILCLRPRKYIERMVASYEQMFGEKPSTKVTSPLEKNDHPELDDSELCDEEEVRQFQSVVGSLQWAISLGRIDITTAVMTLSRYRSMPRKGHLARAKRVVAYLRKMSDACIRIRTHEPDYSGIPIVTYDWSTSVYGEVEELVPSDAPAPKGRYVTLTHYVDANLYHDCLTGRSVTGILHFVNATPIDWYSKRQATVETATYGSEFVAARTCVEQVMDLRNTLRYLGVPIRGMSWMFGDNESVVNSSAKPHAKLHKRHTALSFHRVREAIAAGIVGFFHIPGDSNPADILSKHWGYQQVWQLLQPLLFWQGDTADIGTYSPSDDDDNG